MPSTSAPPKHFNIKPISRNPGGRIGVKENPPLGRVGLN